MNSRARRVVAACALALGLAGAAHWWLQRDQHTYLTLAPADFVTIFAAPPARDSALTRAEIDALLELQRTRTTTTVAAARADRKTEIQRFYGALGFADGADPELPLLRGLAERVENDIQPYTRAAKRHFRRLRPYEVDARIEPCIGNVQDDLSYPSGHATYGYVMAYLLSEMVPERRDQLLARAGEFARQRMICGVHFSSDLQAGRTGARWLASALDSDPGYRADAYAAAAELRAALQLAPRAPR